MVKCVGVDTGVDIRWDYSIEEGRAASKVLFKNLPTFFLCLSKQFLPISFQIHLLEYFLQKQKKQRHKKLGYTDKLVITQMSSWDQANRGEKPGLVWRNRKKISQITLLYLPVLPLNYFMGYSLLRHRVPYTTFFFGFGLRTSYSWECYQYRIVYPDSNTINSHNFPGSIRPALKLMFLNPHISSGIRTMKVMRIQSTAFYHGHFKEF